MNVWCCSRCTINTGTLKSEITMLQNYLNALLMQKLPHFFTKKIFCDSLIMYRKHFPFFAFEKDINIETFMSSDVYFNAVKFNQLCNNTLQNQILLRMSIMNKIQIRRWLVPCKTKRILNLKCFISPSCPSKVYGVYPIVLLAINSFWVYWLVFRLHVKSQ